MRAEDVVSYASGGDAIRAVPLNVAAAQICWRCSPQFRQLDESIERALGYLNDPSFPDGEVSGRTMPFWSRLSPSRNLALQKVAA